MEGRREGSDVLVHVYVLGPAQGADVLVGININRQVWDVSDDTEKSQSVI